MDKKEAIKVIRKAAELYHKKWESRNFLVIYGAVSKPDYIEVISESNNFLHLTGVILNERNIMQNVQNNNVGTKEVFYSKCVNGQLSEKDFDFRTDGTTQQKLRVLVEAMWLPTSRKTIEIGHYKGNRPYFKADLILGKTKVCLGLQYRNGFYHPCSVLDDSNKNNTSSRSKVLAILSKEMTATQYSVVESVSSTVDLIPLLKKFHKLNPHIDIDSSLYNSNATLSSTQGGKVENIVQDVAGFSSGGAAVLDTFTFRFPSPKHIFEMIVEKALELFNRLTSKKEHSPIMPNESLSPSSKEEPTISEHSDKPLMDDLHENEIKEKQESKKRVSTPPPKTEPHYILLENDKQLDCLKQSGIPFEIRTLNDGSGKYIVSVKQKDKEAAHACLELSQHMNKIKR